MSLRQEALTNSQATRVRLFFDQTSDEKFLVLAEVLSATCEEKHQLSIHTFEHEDRFLELLVLADLPIEDTSLLAGTVLRSVDQSPRGRNWMELSLTGEQIAALGLENERLLAREDALATQGELISGGTAFEFAQNSSQFYQFLIHSPTPFVMLSGAQHRITFINQPYVDLIGNTTVPDVLLKTIREVIPELEGQPFFRWLDEVYLTGVQHVGKQQMAHIRHPSGAGYEDRYFDFVYYPVRNSRGRVYGVMVQAADVTDKVRAEAVTEHREETLFRQWAELDAIYRTAPVGMALLDAKSLTLLRLNEKQAEMMGAPMAELLGKKALELLFVPLALQALFRRVMAGETVRNAIVEKAVVAGATGHRTWLVNISPFLGASGEALAFTSISMEIPDEG